VVLLLPPRGLRSEPFAGGWIYVLPRTGFIPEPPLVGKLDTAQWVSSSAVRSVGRVAVKPSDFPFRDLVVTHREREPMFVTWLRAGVRARVGPEQGSFDFPGTTMPDLATRTVAAAQQLYGTAAANVVRQAFVERGILS
jgi:hypothetical protein